MDPFKIKYIGTDEAVDVLQPPTLGILFGVGEIGFRKTAPFH